MVQFRILTYLVPRLSQVFGWTATTEPLLKQENRPIYKKVEVPYTRLYQPPPFVPSNDKQTKLKGNF